MIGRFYKVIRSENVRRGCDAEQCKGCGKEEAHKAQTIATNPEARRAKYRNRRLKEAGWSKHRGRPTVLRGVMSFGRTGTIRCAATNVRALRDPPATRHNCSSPNFP
jgi:hypothetical protein